MRVFVHAFQIVVLAVLLAPAASHASEMNIDKLRCQAIHTPTLDPAKGEIGYTIFGKQNLLFSKPKEWVVIIHGMGGDGSGFEDVIKVLKKNYMVLVVQQRGHAKSQTTSEDFSTIALASDLRSLTDYLGIHKFSIIGHSMGARVAARFTTLYPERVNKLIIEDMDLIQRTNADPEYQRRVVLKSREVRRRAAAGFDTKEEMAQALYPFFNAPDFAGVMEGAEQMLNGKWTIGGIMKPDTYLMYWNQANTDRDFLQNLALANRPTLILRADPEVGTVITDGGVRLIGKLFPQAKLVTVPGSDHSIHASQAQAYNSLVVAFLKSAQGSK